MPTATVRLAPPPAAPNDLHAALAEVDRRVGAGVAFNPTHDSPLTPAAIPTGCPTLDAALGVGGIPRGRITEVYGPDGAGKTTLVLSVIAQAQQHGGTACFIDTEYALDLAWATTVGVDLERLVLCRPEHGEQALQVAELLVRSGSLDVLVVDSSGPRWGCPSDRSSGHPASGASGVQASGPIQVSGRTGLRCPRRCRRPVRALDLEWLGVAGHPGWAQRVDVAPWSAAGVVACLHRA